MPLAMAIPRISRNAPRPWRETGRNQPPRTSRRPSPFPRLGSNRAQIICCESGRSPAVRDDSSWSRAANPGRLPRRPENQSQRRRASTATRRDLSRARKRTGLIVDRKSTSVGEFILTNAGRGAQPDHDGPPPGPRRCRCTDERIGVDPACMAVLAGWDRGKRPTRSKPSGCVRGRVGYSTRLVGNTVSRV